MVKNIFVSSDIVLYAFRYCLGRKTYAVSDFVHEIIGQIENIDENIKNIMIREIDNSKDLGMTIDKAEWLRLRGALNGKK